MVGPKREKLREAETSLAEANRKLAEKQAMLKAVIDRVEGLQRQLSTAQQEQKDLNDQVGEDGLRGGGRGIRVGWVEEGGEGGSGREGQGRTDVSQLWGEACKTG